MSTFQPVYELPTTSTITGLSVLADTASVTEDSEHDNTLDNFINLGVQCKFTAAAATIGSIKVYLLSGLVPGALSTTAKSTNIKLIGSVALNGTTPVISKTFSVNMKDVGPFWKLHFTNNSGSTVSSETVKIIGINYASGIVGAVSGGTVSLSWSTTEVVANGIVMTITTDGTYDFTTKANVKPICWFDSSEGTLLPNSTIGRISTWLTPFQGDLSTSVVEANSSQSVALDLSLDVEGLGRVPLSTQHIYMYRKTHDAFDVTTDYARRTRAELVSGTLNIGDTVTGDTSGATGIIQSFKLYSDGGSTTATHEIYYEAVGGTINDPTPIDFIGTPSYEGLTSNTGAVLNSTEYAGLFRTFNDKVLRAWNKGVWNNFYIGPQGIEGNDYNQLCESTDTAVSSPSFDNLIVQLPNQWANEELEIIASSVGVQDGQCKYYQNGRVGYTGLQITQDATRTGVYTELTQHLVSNGCQLGSFIYYDCLYVDDTLHRVIISPNSVWTDNVSVKYEIQLPLSWTSNTITVQLRKGALAELSGNYLYVLDDTGSPVSAAGVII